MDLGPLDTPPRVDLVQPGRISPVYKSDASTAQHTMARFKLNKKKNIGSAKLYFLVKM